MNNKYPIFIPTKSRFKTPLTINMFKKQRVDFTIVIEEQEYDDYAKIVDKSNILVVPHKNKGVTQTRNWLWNYAESKGYEKYWTFDDNIGRVYRRNHNRKIQVADGTYLKVIEDFADRYENLYLIGMNYSGFAPTRDNCPIFYLNTRVYSNMLLTTNAKFSNGEKIRWKLFYNEDTDLCLRLLKDGLPTLQLNAFLIDKTATMVLKGGNTEYYQSEECKGRYKFVEELVNAHSDVVTFTEKFNRTHHQVNYKPFRKNKLVRKQGLVIPNRINEYGMELVDKISLKK